MAPTAPKGTSPKSVMEIFHNQSTVSFRIWGRQEGADEIEKELDGALVRAERLRGAVFPQHFVCGMMKSAACPVHAVGRD